MRHASLLPGQIKKKLVFHLFVLARLPSYVSSGYSAQGRKMNMAGPAPRSSKVKAGTQTPGFRELGGAGIHSVRDRLKLLTKLFMYMHMVNFSGGKSIALPEFRKSFD